MQITESQFYEKYSLVKNHIDKNASFEGCMFETFGPELQHICSLIDANRVWTITAGDEGELVVGAGFHYVNRIGYLITTEPWSNDTEHFVDQY